MRGKLNFGGKGKERWPNESEIVLLTLYYFRLQKLKKRGGLRESGTGGRGKRQRQRG